MQKKKAYIKTFDGIKFYNGEATLIDEYEHFYLFQLKSYRVSICKNDLKAGLSEIKFLS